MSPIRMLRDGGVSGGPVADLYVAEGRGGLPPILFCEERSMKVLVSG